MGLNDSTPEHGVTPPAAHAQPSAQSSWLELASLSAGVERDERTGNYPEDYLVYGLDEAGLNCLAAQRTLLPPVPAVSSPKRKGPSTDH